MRKLVCRRDLVHVLGAAFQSKKKDPHKLLMYPIWPNGGLWLADFNFVLRMS